jgi:hypothetical protein
MRLTQQHLPQDLLLVRLLVLPLQLLKQVLLLLRLQMQLQVLLLLQPHTTHLMIVTLVLKQQIQQ